MTLLEEPRLAIAPRRSILLARDFDVADGEGRPVAIITGDGVRFRLLDLRASAVAEFGRPWVLFLTRVDVLDHDGSPVGSVGQVTPFGRVRFQLADAEGAPTGMLEPEGFGAQAFGLLDADGAEQGRIERKWGFFMRTGEYLVTFGPGTDRDLRLLAIGGVIAIDKAIGRRRRANSAPPAGAGGA
jgi:hypothetical protein